MIEELFRAARAEQERKAIPALADELLREAAERYAATRQNCPFRLGSMITPRKDSGYKGAGEPHFVVELNPSSAPNFSVGTPSSPDFGHIVDVRVLCYAGGNITPYWVESWQFELWTPAKPEAANQQ